MKEEPVQTIGRYQLLAHLASGGMAEIYLARQTGIGGFEKLVVVKKILPNLAREKVFVEMFLDEAVIAAQLNHPNVVQIYDLGQSGDDYYIAMEFLEGESLGHLTSEGARVRKPLPPGMAAGIISQVCEGLAYAHAFEDETGKPLGIVHRDISPHNIIVLFTGVVKVVDFGIAKAASKMHQTKVGTLKGKLAYMSPEQCMGSQVDARSDLFSLGVVLWELLTHRRLFKRDVEPAMIRAIMDEPIPKVNEVHKDAPAALAAVADKALCKKPQDRYKSAAEMKAEIQAYLRQESLEAGPEQISAYAHEVLGKQARTKKRLLEEIRKKGAKGVSVGALKPKSDSMPSQSGGDAGDLADAATRIKDERDAPASSPWLLRIAAFFLVGLAVGAAILWFSSGSPPPEPTEEPVAVPAPPPPEIPVEPAKVKPPATALLSVRSTPSGCSIELDGKALEGTTPLVDHPVAPDTEHQVAVLCQGHRKDTRTIKGKPGEMLALAFAPAKESKKPRVPRTEPVVKKGMLTIDTKPWTEIHLGKRKLGITPLLNVELPAGRHRLKIINKGRGINETLEVVVKAGKKTTIKKTLIP
jgi:serine/threonine protein kinase